MKKSLLAVLVVSFFGLLYYGLNHPPSHALTSSMAGEPVPAFELPTLNDKQTFSSKELAKGRYSLVNIFASWCEACRDEHATLMMIEKTHLIPIYGILYEDKASAAKQFLASHGNPYVKVGNDANGEVSVGFGVYGTPETYLISPTGKIVYRHVGTLNKEVWNKVIYPTIKKEKTP